MHQVLRRLARSARTIAGLEYAGRSVTVWPDDIFLVSYPKSGNTWLRFLVGNLVSSKTPVTFANVESIIPSIYVNPDCKLQQLRRPRIMKSHESFVSRYRRVVYIVRDPRDVCLSFYHYLIKYRELPLRYPMEPFVPRFIADEFGQYGQWGDHVMSWLAMRESRAGFLLLRYEDLLKNPEQELGRVASFLELPATLQQLVKAVSLSSADRMRGLERLQSREWISTKKSRQDMPFVRSATAGEWKSALGEPLALQIEEAWGPMMRSLGYELQGDVESATRYAESVPKLAAAAFMRGLSHV